MTDGPRCEIVERPCVVLATRGNSRVHPDPPPSTWPREEIDRAETLMSMALAEAGYPVEWEWVDAIGQPAVTRETNVPIPLEVMDRARVLVLRALGREFTLDEDFASMGPDSGRHSELDAEADRG